MPITVTCTCGKQYQVANEHAGKAFTCKACNTKGTVPVGTEQSTTPNKRHSRSSSLDSPSENDHSRDMAQAPASAPATDTKPCPHCGESIKPTAVVCKHCGRNLSPAISRRAAIIIAMIATPTILLSAIAAYTLALKPGQLTAPADTPHTPTPTASPQEARSKWKRFILQLQQSSSRKEWMTINGYAIDTLSDFGLFTDTTDPLRQYIAETKLVDEKFDPASNTAQCTLKIVRVCDTPEDLFRPKGSRRPNTKDESYVRMHMYYSDNAWLFDKAEYRKVDYTWNTTRVSYDVRRDSEYVLRNVKAYAEYAERMYATSGSPPQP